MAKARPTKTIYADYGQYLAGMLIAIGGAHPKTHGTDLKIVILWWSQRRRKQLLLFKLVIVVSVYFLGELLSLKLKLKKKTCSGITFPFKLSFTQVDDRHYYVTHRVPIRAT